MPSARKTTKFTQTAIARAWQCTPQYVSRLVVEEGMPNHSLAAAVEWMKTRNGRPTGLFRRILRTGLPEEIDIVC